jgi:hypothetical protein
LQECPKELKKGHAMVHERGKPPSKAKEGQRLIMVRYNKGILKAVSREKSGRDIGLLVYNSQQESELKLLKNNQLFSYLLIMYKQGTCGKHPFHLTVSLDVSNHHLVISLVSVQTTLRVLRTQAMVLASEVHLVSSLCPMVLIGSRHAP